MRIRVYTAALTILFALALYAQEPAAPAPRTDFFSGTIVSAKPTEVVVNRKNLTRDSVTKTFIIDDDTKVEGDLKPKAHVTVQFVTTETGARAIHIIVR